MTGIVLTWTIAALPSLLYLAFAASYFIRSRPHRRHVERLLGVDTVRDFYVKAYRVEGQSADMAEQVLPKWTGHLVPLVLCVTVTLPVSVAAVAVAGLPLGLPATVESAAKALTPVSLAGFAGGYLWGLLACVERFRVVNWSASFVQGLWIRTLIGGLIGGLLPGPLSEPWLAFSLAAFPTTEIRKWVQRRAAATAQLDPVAPSVPAWSGIQGVTPELVERLEEADVTSPTALANVDPFQLFLQSNIAWRHILDLVDQAILAGYVGDKLPALRPMGVRGAIEMALLAERRRLLHPDHPIRKDAEETVERLSAVLAQPTGVTWNLLENLSEDSQVELVWRLWFDEEPARGVLKGAAFENASEVAPRPRSAADRQVPAPRPTESADRR